MTPRGRWMVMAPLAVVAVLAGCTDTNPVGSSASELAVQAEMVGNAGRFDMARLNIRQVRLRPADPTTQQALGNTEIGLLSFVAAADLNAGGPVTLFVGAPVGDSLPLVAGMYELTRIRFGDFVLADSTMPLPPAAECIDNINNLTTLTSSTAQPMDVTVSDFNPPVMVEVRAGDPSELRFALDVPAFIELIESRFVCSPTSSCSGGRLPPCLALFNPPSSTQLKSILSFP